MRRPALALATALAAAGAAGAPAATPPGHGGNGGREPAAREATVTIPARVFAPARLAVVPGTRVTWRNDDGATHVVRLGGGGVDSGRIPPGGSFSHAFDETGRHRYVCTIHPYMTGSVEVSPVTLALDGEPPRAGGAARIRGSVPPGTGHVAIERLAADGSAAVVADAHPAPDGVFAASVPLDAPARLRARAGADASPALTVRVAPALALEARRARRLVRAEARVAPAQPGGRVVLERYSRERFGWVRLASAPLRGGAVARLAVRSRAQLRLRARLARPARGWGRAVSRSAGVPGG